MTVSLFGDGFFFGNRSASFGSDGNSEKGEINGAEMGAGGLNQKEEEHDTGTPTYCMRKKNLLKLGQFKAKSCAKLGKPGDDGLF